MTERRKYVAVWHGVPVTPVLWLSLLAALPACPAQGTLAPIPFALVGATFHARGQDDAGEVRICLRNTGSTPWSMAQLTVQIKAGKPDSSKTPGTEQKYLYARLSPPVLQPGQYGLLVAKFVDRPAQGQALTCVVSAGTAARVTAVTESDLWISYVGFSQDLRRVFVYVENDAGEAIHTEALQAGEQEDKVEGPVGVVHRLVPPQDKGCLIGRLSTALTPGQFTHIAVSARRGDREIQVHSVLRAINRMPLLLVESGAPDPGLGLDLQGFTETMTCIAHAHGTPEEAAGKFLEDYGKRFQQDPHEVIQIDICRSDAPRAWFRFGSLPDVARMNPILPSRTDENKSDSQQWFSPFLYRGHLAKTAVEPCRYLAVTPLVPDEGLFLQKELTLPEVRFLVYCALASGAKGLAYRGVRAYDPLSRSAFVRLNAELRQIEPLLLIGDPVLWAATNDSGYAVRSLLCGDQAILVMVFDRRYFSQQRNDRFYTPPFPKAVAPVKIKVRVPGEISVRQVRSLSAPLDRGSWACREGRLDFTVAMSDCIQLYLVDLQSETRPSGG